MKVENRIVCFIDILGFSSVVEGFEKTQDISVIEKIRDAFDYSLKVITNAFDIGGPSDYYKKKGVTEEHFATLKRELLFRSFSDNVIITLPYTESRVNFFTRLHLIILFSNTFQYNMTSKGIYTRGGISFGSFYSDENIIFSTALINAYNLEKNIAQFPRIVIDQKIIEKIIREKSKITHLSIFNFIYTDWENVAFLSPFSYDDEAAKEMESAMNDIIARQLKGISNTSDFMKLYEQVKPYKTILDQNAMIAADARNKSKDKNYSNSIRNKYSWLVEFYNWKYTNEPVMLKFKLLSDIL